MRYLIKISVLLLCLPVLCSAFPVCADEITELIQQGEKAYSEKQYQESIRSLYQAIQKVQGILSQELAGFLPGQIQGWNRGEVRSETIDGSSGPSSASSSFFSTSVEYRKDGAPDKVQVTLTNAPQLVQMAKIPFELLQNPYFQKMSEEDESGEKIETYRLQDLEGYKRVIADDQEAEINVFYADVMLHVQGTSLSDVTSIDQFASQADLEGIKRFSSGSE